MTKYNSPSTGYKPTHGGYPGTVEDQLESKSEERSWVCLTCGDRLTGWGNNPWPINSVSPEFADREVCSDCNTIHVIPARLGRPVSGRLYDGTGKWVGGFETGDEEGPE